MDDADIVIPWHAGDDPVQLREREWLVTNGLPGMTKQLFVISVCLPFVAALVLGCAAASDAVDDAITVEVGAESLQPVEMDHSMSFQHRSSTS